MKMTIYLAVLAVASSLNLHASTRVSTSESAREEITNLTILDLRDYPHYRYLPSDRFGLLARCVAEKRIQMAKTIDCKWTEESDSSAGDSLDHLLQCLARGGFGEAQNQTHREFCAFLMREHFRALESSPPATRSLVAQ